MNKTLLLYVLLIGSTITINAQCPQGSSGFTPAFNGSTLVVGTRTQVSNTTWANEYVILNNVVAGYAYRFDSCGAPYDSEITVYDETNSTPGDGSWFNTNGCGDDGQFDFTATSSGNYKFQVNDFNCTNNATNTALYVTLISTLGVEENTLNLKTSLYPNPSNGNFTVSYSGQEPLKELQVIDYLGRRVQSISLENFKGSKEINLSALAKGIYFISIETETAKVSKRMIIE
jgi:hypothetical protein